MILFPFAKDVDYKDNRLTVTLEFFNNTMKSDVSLSIALDPDISDVIEEMLERGDSE